MSQTNPSTENESMAAPPKRRRTFIIAGAAGFLVLASIGGWFAYSRLLGDTGDGAAAHGGRGEAPANMAYTQLPEIIATLPEGSRVARVGLVLETPQAEKSVGQPELLRITEEVRRWVAAQHPGDLEGPAALWTVRARSLAIARQLYPELGARDVLIRVLLVQ
jgi:hypothetical protein